MKMQNEGVKTIIEDASENIWFGTSGGLARYSGDGSLRTFDEVEGLKTKDVNAIAAHSSGDIFLGTNTGGIYKYNHLKNDTVAIDFVVNDSLLLSNSIRSLLFLNDSVLVAGTFKGFDKIFFDSGLKIKRVKHYTANDGFIGLECNDNAIFLDADKNIWFGTVNGLTKYSPASDNKVVVAPKILITDILLAYKEVNWDKWKGGKQAWVNVPNELTLAYYQNILTFKFHANDFTNPDNLVYKFKLVGRDKDWSPARKKTEEEFSGLEPGKYTMMVMAGNSDGLWSQPASFSFVITPPWYGTTLFYVVSIVLIVLLVYGYIKWREKKLVQEKKILEDTVRERTHEVEVQKEYLAEKNKEITDSITYAQGIQQAMLPPISDVHAAWPDLFIFFQPKDIVSGDFYWFQQINKDEFLIACADCTGHGVPGGFMSMICSEKLHDAAKETTEPAQILNRTNNGVKTALRQQILLEGKSKDGMEICLIKVNTSTRQVSYSGAHRPLWHVDGATRELTEIKATKASIASFTEFGFEYQQTELVLKQGDVLYASSDGFPDQFGGTGGKKYKSKNLKDFMTENCHLPMAEQQQLFKSEINNWKGNFEQVDDLLVIGIKL
jgi:serine phosphatase RsbU (regulator of sigma subunit)